jgi:methylated-DNA-[protein]-cysteine S-methyltransferase
MCAALWTRNLREGLPGDRVAAEPAPEQTARSEMNGRSPESPRGAPPTDARRALAYGSCPSPFGTIHLAASADGICAVSLYETEAAFGARLAPVSWGLACADALLAQAAAELAEYFTGARQTFDVPLDLTSATPFDRRVLAAIAAIPYGQTRTYGTLAREVGSAGAARAVGHACGRNPVPLLIACHRVVRAGGGMGGFSAGGPDVKARLLALERGGLPL